MARTVTALVAGVLLGILTMLAVTRFGLSGKETTDEIVRDIADVPRLAREVAEKHRDERYARLTTVEEIIALPTEFARSEALHVLAGRSDSAGVQNLIFEANRIADEVERVKLLNILFFRLAETDPQSALALARTDYFNGIKSIEETVWRAWARKDLDDALFAAKAQTSVSHRNLSAQSLYAAFGYMGNEATDLIEEELGIGPDRASRGRYLYLLADRSPAEAIAFINGLKRGVEQQEYVSWLAFYLSLRDPNGALEYADLFSVASDGEQYRSIIDANIARENPHATMERLLADGNIGRSGREYQNAIRALASTDLDVARQYFEHARSNVVRQTLGPTIAAEMAKNDPLEALMWARANDKDRFPYLEMSVLRQIAQLDPQLALTAAQNTPRLQMRSNMVANVVQFIAQYNPADAIAYLDQIQDRQQKLEMGQQLASSWIGHDPEAAIDWIVSQDKETAGQIARMATLRLLDSDIDAAIRMLPMLREQDQGSMRQHIAQRLALNHSLIEAQSFIRQFIGQPGYDQLQASVVTGVADTDPLMAKQLADQVASGNGRDRAYVQVIARHARTNPTEAADWLRNIGDDRLRSVAAGQLAAQWYASDPTRATRWLNSLPAGPSRDDAVMQMSFQWRDSTPEQERLIASIEDRGKRGQAKIREIYNVLRTNPAKARQLLEDEDIPSDQRQQIETMISQSDLRFIVN